LCHRGNTLRLRYKNHSINAVRGNIAVQRENYMKHKNALCGHNAKWYYVKAGGTYKTLDLKELL
jgi:hypothetical protein